MTKYDWYQNDTFVVISIYAKNKKPEETEIAVENGNHFNFNLKLDKDSTFNLDLNLFAEVYNPIVNYLSTKIEVKLEKKVPGMKWTTLESKDDTSFKVSYPSSSKNPKNWDEIEKQVKEEEKSKKPEGDEAVNELFRSIYQNASEETRRAMNKSYLESGGTCLSTNWEEVKKDKVKVTPPDGMEAKKFEI